MKTHETAIWDSGGWKAVAKKSNIGCSVKGAWSEFSASDNCLRNAVNTEILSCLRQRSQTTLSLEVL